MKPIAVTKFASMASCGLKPYYYFVEGLRPDFGEWVFLGAEHHNLSALEDAKKPYEELSSEELQSRLAEPSSVIELPNESVSVKFEAEGLTFRGRLDKLVKNGKSLHIIDEKFVGESGGQLHGRYQLQLGAYAWGLKEGEVRVNGKNLGTGVFSNYEVYYRVVERSRADRQVLFESDWEEFERSRFEPHVKRFAAIVRGDLPPAKLATATPQACASCEFRNYCAYSKF